MFILSQDRTRIVELSGVYIRTERRTSLEGGMLSRRAVTYEYAKIICICRDNLGVKPVGHGAGSYYTAECEVGEFNTIARAKKEIENIARAIINQDDLYIIEKGNYSEPPTIA